VRGVCEKPRVKCGECPNQAFVPVSDQAVLDHLQGRHLIGVYPMLEDGGCWLLAADFDKQSWADDVAAFVDTCRAMSAWARRSGRPTQRGAPPRLAFASEWAHQRFRPGSR
jgi:hypothetical protein